MAIFIAMIANSKLNSTNSISFLELKEISIKTNAFKLLNNAFRSALIEFYCYPSLDS